MALKIDKDLNEKNIKIFNRYAISNSSELRHRCVVCGKKCSIDDSYSEQGKKLICHSCAYKHFRLPDSYIIDYQELKKWFHEEDEE